MVVSSLGSSTKFTPLVVPVVPLPASLLDAVGGSVAVVVPPVAQPEASGSGWSWS